jgi:hypothetical protein
MKQRIVGYHQDAESHWVAELECGHGQHVRHDPPWQERPWVVTEEGRAGRLGIGLNCVRCDESSAKVAAAVRDACRNKLIAAFEEAGISGLCTEGRFEFAVDSLLSLELDRIAEEGLRKSELR